MDSVKEIRTRAKCSKTDAAQMAGVSLLTWRVFEASEGEAVSEETRPKCDAAVEKMRAIAKAREAA
jgi:hypothetical protein